MALPEGGIEMWEVLLRWQDGERQEARRPGNGHETCTQAVAGEVGTDSRAGLELASPKEKVSSFVTLLSPRKSR